MYGRTSQGCVTIRAQWYPPRKATMTTTVIAKNRRTDGSSGRFQYTNAATKKTPISSANHATEGNKVDSGGVPTLHQTSNGAPLGSVGRKVTRTHFSPPHRA